MKLNLNPKVSVIIPVYGVEKYIERCAISLFEQTLKEIEYIFVNDCTKDSSIDILMNIVDRYPSRKDSVRIINHKYNMGLPAARKTGIFAAKGDYIIHCDSDDWISVDLYEKLYNSMIETNSDVAICDIKCTDGNTTKSIKKGAFTIESDAFLRDTLRMKSSWSLVNKMFKRAVYSEGIVYPTSYMAEDMALCIQLLSACHHITYINNTFYYYYINNQTESRSEDKEKVIRLYNMFSQNFTIVLNHFKKIGLYDHHRDDLSYTLFLNSLIFAKRAKSISFLIKKEYDLPSTPLNIVFHHTIPFSLRIQSLLFYLLNI